MAFSRFRRNSLLSGTCRAVGMIAGPFFLLSPAGELCGNVTLGSRLAGGCQSSGDLFSFFDVTPETTGIIQVRVTYRRRFCDSPSEDPCKQAFAQDRFSLASY